MKETSCTTLALCSILVERCLGNTGRYYYYTHDDLPDSCVIIEGHFVHQQKMHMFDIDVPGGIRFQESEVLSPGNGFLTFDTGIIYL